MRFIQTAAIPSMLALLASPPVLLAQKAGAEWKALQKEAEELYDAGKYDPALVAAKKARAIAEQKAGPNHPDTATSLEIVGLILVEQGQYAQAEPLHNRALEIREKALGPNHKDVASSLDNLAAIYQAQGHYPKAEPFYQRSLAIKKKALGPDHPDVAMSLNNLGLLFRDQGQYTKAEPLYKRALAIWEKALGPAHPDVANALNNLADLYSSQGGYAQAEALFRRALAIREKAFGPDHPKVALSLNNLAVTLEDQSKYAEAEPLKKRALAIREKALGPDHPDVALSLSNLGYVYKVQGLYVQAEPLYQRAVTIVEKALGPNHPQVAARLSALARLYDDEGQYARSEPLKKRALAITEKALGSDHPDVALRTHDLAWLYREQGRYAEAEPLFKKAVAIWEKALGPDHPKVGTGLGNLAQLYELQGMYAQAEPLYRRTLAIQEKALGLDHPHVAMSLSNLAFFFEGQGEYAQAEPLYLRALAIVEKVLGKDHRDAGSIVNNLAVLYFRQGQYAKAEPLFHRALEIDEKALGPEHPSVAASLNNLGDFYRFQKRYPEAEACFVRSLAIKEKVFGPDHPDVAGSLNNLAKLHSLQGHYTQAEPLYQRALAIWQQSFGPDHPSLAATLVNFADFYEAQGQLTTALPLIRRVSNIYRQRIVTGGTSDAPAQEATRNRDGFFKHLSLLSRNPDKEPAAYIADETFQVAQLEQATGTGAAVARMAARFAKGDDAIAILVRRKQDAIDILAKAQNRLVKASGRPPEQRKADEEQKLRDDILRLGKDIDAVDAELTARFPEYQVLTQSDPMRVNQAQALLRSNEAMIVFEVAKDQAWMWVVRAKSAEFISLKITEKALSEDIKKLRKQMEMGAPGQLRKVDVATLHSLYQRVFAPAVPHLAGIKHLMLVPSGPMQSLPFAMLVASPPKEIKTNKDYRQVDWLMKRYALSVLPSVGSIQAFRKFAKPGQAQKPFIGFGDPLLKEDPGAMPSERAKLRLTGLFRNPSAPHDTAVPVDVADVEIIRQQVRLPESGAEIRAMAGIVKAGPDSIWLQEKATERNVKTLDLSIYRMVAFATHGVMADEFGYGLEPGLLLTPPAQGTLEDDGYLAAGEIARLKLNADWVLLSACNTAAADGSPGAEGMSGLAKAFFYAGSRSLLVSHWPVASEATVALTTTMLREYEARPGRGKAEAHRKAMLALMNTPKHPEYAHPLFWAPFVVVGEGGGTSAKPDPR